MSLVSQWTYLFGRGFTGGPDFDVRDTYVLGLDGLSLEATLPRDNLVVEDMSQRLNFPFRSSGWFDGHSKQLWNHIYVPLLAHNWVYLGPYWKVMNEPFGVLSVNFWLKRVPAERALSNENPTNLEHAIHIEYRDYFEAEQPGELGLGSNTEVRQRAEQMFAPKPYPTGRDLNAEKELHLQQYLREIPNKFERKNYGDRDWVCFGLEKEPMLPAHHYCHALDERFYLDVVFHYRIDYRQYFPLWKDHAEAAEQRIMNSVRLTFPNS